MSRIEKDSHGRFNSVGKAYVDGGEFSQKVAEIRFKTFKKQMTLALSGIVYGDRPFYTNYPALIDALIFIHYLSTYPEYRQVAFYGTPRQYLNQSINSPDLPNPQNSP
ncbi:staygreen family protein [Fictibacillus nanhaiensis]|uniref:staygreen family protein n=1 Tax=Fictibacillus nanhaiensis TaxID=742169 RepID=UPI003C29A46F